MCDWTIYLVPTESACQVAAPVLGTLLHPSALAMAAAGHRDTNMMMIMTAEQHTLS